MKHLNTLFRDFLKCFKGNRQEGETFFKLSPDVICITSAGGYIKEVNTACEKMLECERKDLVGKRIFNFIQNTDESIFLEDLKHLRTGNVLNFESTLQCKDGRVKVLDWTFFNGASPDHIFSIARDITEKKFVQNTFLETILDNIPDMIFVKEAKDLRFVRFNNVGQTLLGYHKDDLIGKNDYDLFPKEQADFFTSKDRAVLLSGKLLEIPDEPIQTSTKEKRSLYTKKIPVYDQQGNPQFLIGISEDITEKKLRLEAEKSLSSRDEFISIASHELKTPLSSLKLQTQILKRKLEKDDENAYSKEKIYHFVNQTDYQLTRLNRLVEDMLDVSRIRTGNLTMKFELFNLYKLISEILDRMKEQFLAAPCGVPEFEASSVEIFGNWDRMRIEQVVVNLLSNAIRYGGNHVLIELGSNEHSAYVVLKDRGPGIPRDKLELIFDRFEKATEEGHIEGLGLGLYITKKIVEAHGGEIKAESEKGTGSTFFVKLPLTT